jgi:hypothetical protein
MSERYYSVLRYVRTGVWDRAGYCIRLRIIDRCVRSVRDRSMSVTEAVASVGSQILDQVQQLAQELGDE